MDPNRFSAPPVDQRLGARIRSSRIERGMSLQQLADVVGCSRSHLCMLESGDRGAGGAVARDLLGRIESALGLEPDALCELARWAATPSEVRGEVERLRTSQRAAANELRVFIEDLRGQVGGLDAAHRSGKLQSLIARLDENAAGAARRGNIVDERPRGMDGALLPRQVPLINSVAAGYPREFTDLGYPARTSESYVRTLDVDDPDAFAARVVGDSMLPEYREGDVVVFSPNRPVKNGMDCFVRLERDQETTFKRVVLEGPEGSERIRLVALNPAYAQRVLEREDVAFMCPAVSVTRAVG
ncbi:MAG: helix-turn-helix domain-containing protein [Phycisphaerales bacterium]|nr:helix-turn-helix domain-containing protein [Phycisphaerales bacterium]